MARFTRKKKRTITPPKGPSVVTKVSSRTPAKRLQWTRAQMEAAIKAVMCGSGISINRAARDHGIPPTTLKDRLSGRVVDGTKPGPIPYLSNDEEAELEEYLTQSVKVGYGKTRRQVKAIAENVATEKGVLRSSRISDGWWRRFLQRHPSLSLRSGDATGHVRMNAMTEENLTNYFDLLRDCMFENDLNNHPERIYNMDESGMPLDPKPPKVVAVRGQKKVRYHCSGMKSQITILGCCSGTGQAMPPFIIFDAKQLNHQWTRGEVPGTRYGLSDSGWTERTLFHGWLVEHFLAHAVPGRPLLLLVDGHSSHYDPDSIRFARSHSVIIFCLPPHTTHEAQPLDVSFFGPLKKNWGDVCHRFIQASPGKVITRFNFNELFSQAWLKTCSPEIICGGFRRAGIIPFSPETLIQRCPGSESSLETRRKDAGVSETPDSGGAENSDISSEGGSDTHEDGQEYSSTVTFSLQQEELFARRFEEGYDFHDENYSQWLSVNHPEAVSAAQLNSVVDCFTNVEPTVPVTSPDHPGSSSPEPSSSLLVPESSSSNESPQLFSSPEASIPDTPPETLPRNAVSQFNTPSRKRSPLVPVNCMSSNTPVAKKVSPLSKYLPNIVLQEPKTKPGHARVLTSSECMEMLEEKKRKKEEEAKEKEERKVKRERAKILKEQELQKKKEERMKRQKQRQEAVLKKKQEVAARKLAAAAKKQATKTRLRAHQVRSEAAANTRSATTPCIPSTSRGAQAQPQDGSGNGSSIGPTTRPAVLHEDSNDENCECAFCYGSYSQDGEEWVRCACRRWVHETCMEEVILDEDGDERFCPFSISSMAPSIFLLFFGQYAQNTCKCNGMVLFLCNGTTE